MEKTNQQLIPYFDRLFVQRDETVEKTKSGVIIPDSDKEKPNRGTVISVGPDCKFAYPGQRIIFGQHHGIDIMIGIEEITILREQDIYAGEPAGIKYIGDYGIIPKGATMKEALALKNGDGGN